jgi:hypothetical protein
MVKTFCKSKTYGGCHPKRNYYRGSERIDFENGERIYYPKYVTDRLICAKPRLFKERKNKIRVCDLNFVAHFPDEAEANSSNFEVVPALKKAILDSKLRIFYSKLDANSFQLGRTDKRYKTSELNKAVHKTALAIPHIVSRTIGDDIRPGPVPKRKVFNIDIDESDVKKDLRMKRKEFNKQMFKQKRGVFMINKVSKKDKERNNRPLQVIPAYTGRMRIALDKDGVEFLSREATHLKKDVLQQKKKDLKQAKKSNQFKNQFKKKKKKRLFGVENIQTIPKKKQLTTKQMLRRIDLLEEEKNNDINNIIQPTIEGVDQGAIAEILRNTGAGNNNFGNSDMENIENFLQTESRARGPALFEDEDIYEHIYE